MVEILGVAHAHGKALLVQEPDAVQILQVIERCLSAQTDLIQTVCQRLERFERFGIFSGQRLTGLCTRCAQAEHLSCVLRALLVGALQHTAVLVEHEPAALRTVDRRNRLRLFDGHDHAAGQVALDRHALKVRILCKQSFLTAQAVAEEQVVPLLDAERVQHVLRIVAGQTHDLQLLDAEKGGQRQHAAHQTEQNRNDLGQPCTALLAPHDLAQMLHAVAPGASAAQRSLGHALLLRGQLLRALHPCGHATLTARALRRLCPLLCLCSLSGRLRRLRPCGRTP